MDTIPFWGSRQKKIILSCVIGLIFASLVPAWVWEWAFRNIGTNKGLRGIPFLFGFPFVIFLERLHQHRTIRRIDLLIEANQTDQAKQLVRSIFEYDPEFYEKVKVRDSHNTD